MIKLKILKKYAIILLILISPFIVFMISLYIIAASTGFKGRRGGPQDAFRHTYASAIVSKYISEKTVHVFTRLTERELDSEHDQMDIHNNTLGARIGQMPAVNLYDEVLARVKSAQVNATDKDVIRILPEERWDQGF